MSLSKALAMLQEMERAENQSDTKRLARVVKEALSDIERRLKELETQAFERRR